MQCPLYHQCSNQRCIEVESKPPTLSSFPEEDLHRLGLYYLMAPGISGDDKNPVAAHSVGFQYEPRLNNWVRYRAAIGYENLNRGTGLRLDVLSFAFHVPLTHLPEMGGTAGSLFLTPVVGIGDFELLKRDAFNVYTLSGELSAGLGVSWKGLVAMFSPLGLQLRYLTVRHDWEESVTTGPLSLNWPVRLVVGVSL